MTTIERPMLFSAPMVKAILDGRKTQTRRIVKTQPLAVFHLTDSAMDCKYISDEPRFKTYSSPDGFELPSGKRWQDILEEEIRRAKSDGLRGMVCAQWSSADKWLFDCSIIQWAKEENEGRSCSHLHGIPRGKTQSLNAGNASRQHKTCSKSHERQRLVNFKDSRIQVGTILWCKETWRPVARIATEYCIWYRADGNQRTIKTSWETPTPKMDAKIHLDKWQPSIFMPRWASRITLEVTGVKVERLQDIGKDGRKAHDVLAEGITQQQIEHWRKWLHPDDAPAHTYGVLWESINGKGSWSKNPWVWCYSFKRI